MLGLVLCGQALTKRNAVLTLDTDLLDVTLPAHFSTGLIIVLYCSGGQSGY